MKLAAVDIGSNAARLQISAVLQDGNDISLKRVEFIRFPLRLGQDVFTTKKLGPARQAMLFKFLHACKLLMELHEVDEYLICATSALRESENAAQIVEQVRQELGLAIQVIDGDQEAELVGKVIAQTLDHKSYLHIDVGGGSTELNLYAHQKKVASQSFQIGSVRQLEHPPSPVPWQQMQDWITRHTSTMEKPLVAVGTGGNMNKIYDLSPTKQKQTLTRTEILSVRDFVARHTVAERIHKLKLNPDRADVIVPATDIYLRAMEWSGAKDMRVPDVGLKDGMIQLLFEKVVNRGQELP